MRLLARISVTILAVVGLGALVAGAIFIAGGISARSQPGRMETFAARRLRSFGIPRAANQRKNPTAPTPANLQEGMAHFADHCAVCHGNDGSGDTDMGRGLYPRPPDLRKEATRALSDGALLFIIENGVRLTGMPGLGSGTRESEVASWHLVQFIRHLPSITDQELEEMQRMNPKSPDEWRQEEEERRFLSGENETTTPPGKARGGHR
jgi:mono/diheme cytochrome c family protein